MAAIDTSRAQFAPVRPFARVGQVFIAAFAAIAQWNDARLTRNALSRLSDRELEDIGLCRGDIESVVARGV